MNKEQKKFKEVIKKRKKRVMRLKRGKPPVHKWVEMPTQVQAPSFWVAPEKLSWWDKLKLWLKRK